MRTPLSAAVFLAALAGGCTTQPVIYSAPAPAGALSCALGQASNLGYQPLEGGVSGGFIKFGRRNAYRASDAGREAAARVLSVGMAGSNRLEWDHLTVTEAAGALRIQAVGIYENGKAGKPSDNARAHAEAMLAGCANPSDLIRP